MKKFIIAVFISTLAVGSTTTFASGNPESTLAPIRAQDILNLMACRDKRPEEKIKDRTDGTIVKCSDVMKKVEEAQAKGATPADKY